LSRRTKEKGAAQLSTAAGWELVHCGHVDFHDGAYKLDGGSSGWHVQPIPGFGQEIGPPLGQVRIVFESALDTPYIVLVSASRTPGCPLLCANHGDLDAEGFVVCLFDPVSTRTLQNGGFTFATLRSLTDKEREP
jgi:hypothetical protein